MKKNDHWKNQPRDPGGKDGGRWVRAGARISRADDARLKDKRIPGNKKKGVGTKGQRTLAGRRLEDTGRLAWIREDARSGGDRRATTRMAEERQRMLRESEDRVPRRRR